MLAAARMTVLSPLDGTVTVDGVYEVSETTIKVISPAVALTSIGTPRYYLALDCPVNGEQYVKDNIILTGVLYDSLRGNRRATLGAGGSKFYRSVLSGGNCQNLNTVFTIDGSQVSLTGDDQDVLAANAALNVGQFTAPYDVQALFVP